MADKDLRTLIIDFLRFDHDTRKKITRQVGLWDRKLDKMGDLDFSCIVFKEALAKGKFEELIAKIKYQNASEWMGLS